MQKCWWLTEYFLFNDIFDLQTLYKKPCQDNNQYASPTYKGILSLAPIRFLEEARKPQIPYLKYMLPLKLHKIKFYKRSEYQTQQTTLYIFSPFFFTFSVFLAYIGELQELNLVCTKRSIALRSQVILLNFCQIRNRKMTRLFWSIWCNSPEIYGFWSFVVQSDEMVLNFPNRIE